MIEGKQLALVLAFLSFASLIALLWLVLLNDAQFADGEVMLAAIGFMLIGVISGSIASADGSKKQ